MPTQKKYPDEMRERSVRLVLGLVEGEEQASVTGACSRVGAQLGINPGAAQRSPSRAGERDPQADRPTGSK